MLHLSLHLYLILFHIDRYNLFQKESNQGIVTFKLIGNGFRRYMVRHLVGGLIQVGAHRITKEFLEELLRSKGKKKCLFKAKPQGLYLHEVFYKYFSIHFLAIIFSPLYFYFTIFDY